MNTYLGQIEIILSEYSDLAQRSKYKDLSDLDTSLLQQLITSCRAVIHRAAGSGSPYTDQLSDLLRRNLCAGKLLTSLVGVVKSLHADLKAGYLKTVSELIHGEVFGDFLEMGDHLLENGYKDAAAVVAGSTLEAHLRQLCQKFGIEIEALDGRGTLRPKKADRMNSDLASASAYSKLDQKSVTAWLDLRNKAAHGEYDKYSLKQVALLNQSVRNFISRNPA